MDRASKQQHEREAHDKESLIKKHTRLKEEFEYQNQQRSSQLRGLDEDILRLKEQNSQQTLQKQIDDQTIRKLEDQID